MDKYKVCSFEEYGALPPVIEQLIEDETCDGAVVEFTKTAGPIETLVDFDTDETFSMRDFTFWVSRYGGQSLKRISALVNDETGELVSPIERSAEISTAELRHVVDNVSDEYHGCIGVDLLGKGA